MQRSVSNVKEIREERLVKYYNVRWPVAELGKRKISIAYNMWNDSESDDEHPPRKRARLYARKEYPDPDEFRERFSSYLFEKLHQDIGQFLIPDDATNRSIDSRHKLLLALRFFATGHFYYSVVRCGIIRMMISFFCGCSLSSE